MNNKITFSNIVARLEENNLPYGVLKLQNNSSVIITQRGGRVFGPFLSEDSESILWASNIFSTKDKFKEYLDSGDWNMGGDRIWLAPEIQYNVKDRTNFFDSYDLPENVDPGFYKLEGSSGVSWTLDQDLILDTYNIASGKKELHIEKIIKKAEDPLRNLNEYDKLIDGVIFSGYEQQISLLEKKADNIASESWSLMQLNPGGRLYIPSVSTAEYTDYYEPVDNKFQQIGSNHIRLEITGNRRYKVGYNAAHVFGRLGYINNYKEDKYYLVIRSFFNNPSALYSEEPSHTPGKQGNSIHVYNDNGGYGGFGELEVNGQTIGGRSGRSFTSDQFHFGVYIGNRDKINKIAYNLLGINV